MIDPGCRAFRAAYLMSEPIAAPALRHGAECPECTRFTASERWVGDALRMVGPRFGAPAWLRERIATTLERERTRVSSPGRRKLLAWVGLAAALTAGVLFAVSRMTGDAPRQRARTTADLVIGDHIKFALAGPERLQVASGEATAVEAFFRRQLGFEATLPTLSNAKLVGGRRCNLAGRPVALAFYEHTPDPAGAQPISLFVFQPGGEDWSGMRAMPELGKRGACCLQVRGVTRIVWEERGLVYALAAARDADELATLLSPTGDGHK